MLATVLFLKITKIMKNMAYLKEMLISQIYVHKRYTNNSINIIHIFCVVLLANWILNNTSALISYITHWWGTRLTREKKKTVWIADVK